MAPPTPSEAADSLARTLGLSTDGSFTPLKGLPPFAELYRVNHLSKEDSVLFFARFNALYLPSLVSTLLSRAPDLGLGVGGWCLFLVSILGNAMGEPGESPSFGRFVRVKTEQSLELYLFFTKIMAVAPASAFKTETLLLCFNLRALVHHLAILVPSLAQLPLLPTSTRVGLSVILPQLVQAAFEAPNGPSTDVYDLQNRFLRSLVNEDRPNPRRLLLYPKEDDIAGPWSSCEARNDDGEPYLCSQTSNDRQEMEACSRCLSVRYCSPEHQKKDWKRHKKECAKPSW